jgi:hypothetical protein
MGGLNRHLAGGILFVGALIALVPFLHLGTAPEKSATASHPPAMPVLAKAPEKAEEPRESERMPEGAGLHLVVAD